MTVQATVDRFEEDLAILEHRATGELLQVPRGRLPPGTRAGDVLQLTTWSPDARMQALPDETAAARDRVTRAQDRLRRKRSPP